MAYQLAVLDMAGTTVRDDGLVERAFVTAVSGLGIEPGTPRMDAALGHVRATMGQSKITVFRALFPDDETRAQEANRRFEAAVDGEVAAGAVAPLPGAAEALAGLRESGLRVCLTTGFSAHTQRRVLDVLDWGALVDLALSPADVARGRPYPDMVLTAVLRLGVDDVRQVAVAGDTVSDLLAGTRAGAGLVAGVTTGAHDAATLATAPHTHILASIAELPGLV